MSSTSGFSNDLGHLFNLSLSTSESSKFLLSELTGSLFLGVSDQFNNSSFIWSKTSDLGDDVSNKESLC